MDAIKVGNFIKELRKKNNLTQSEFGKKYNVTYQAVSKWERGINIPDISLLREISKDFKVNIEDILDGEINTNKEKPIKLIYPYIFGLIAFILIALLVALLVIKNNKSDFVFKTLSSTCSEFKVNGTMAYDKNKSSINISSINYCGGDDTVLYDTISCELFEEEGKEKTLVSKCNKEGQKIKLEDYLKDVEVKVDNYEQKCKSYAHNKLYLEIKAIKDNKTVTYKVNLNLNNNCPVEVK